MLTTAAVQGDFSEDVWEAERNPAASGMFKCRHPQKENTLVFVKHVRLSDPDTYRKDASRGEIDFYTRKDERMAD